MSLSIIAIKALRTKICSVFLHMAHVVWAHGYGSSVLPLQILLRGWGRLWLTTVLNLIHLYLIKIPSHFDLCCIKFWM